MTKINEIQKPLNKEDIELRIGTTSQKGFSLLLYKTARTDINRLNSIYGSKWKNQHFYDSKGYLCCEISIFDEDIKEWITRVDVGTESNTEKEKGSYSDSFKRAGTRFGIGIELYQSPFIWISWEMDSYKKPVKFYASNLSVDEYSFDNGAMKLKISYDGRVIFNNYDKSGLDKSPAKKPITKGEYSPAEKATVKLTAKVKSPIQEFISKLNTVESVLTEEESYFERMKGQLTAMQEDTVRGLFLNRIAELKEKPLEDSIPQF